MKQYKDCQSCGMPLKKDYKGPAYNSDGSLNKIYCTNCFEHGFFKHPDWTADQMQDFVKSKMKQMGYPGFISNLFTRGIPKLERWRK